MSTEPWLYTATSLYCESQQHMCVLGCTHKAYSSYTNSITYLHLTTYHSSVREGQICVPLDCTGLECLITKAACSALNECPTKAWGVWIFGLQSVAMLGDVQEVQPCWRTSFEKVKLPDTSGSLFLLPVCG